MQQTATDRPGLATFGGFMKPKLAFYRLSKCLGLFALAARLNRGKLPILCYHGFASNDQSAFRPKLFMQPESFRARMQYLRLRGYQVLPLEEGVRRLQEGTLPKRPIAITIDDGFYGVFCHAMPVLAEHSFPATVYVTSYCVEKSSPVFRLVVQYMFWKSTCRSLNMDRLVGRGGKNLDLTDGDAQAKAMWELIEYGETRCDEPGRCALAAQLGEELGVDYKKLVSSRSFSLMTPSELRALLENGIDIQLHTHRHRFPENKEIAWQELTDNQRFLQQLSDRPLRHFCYPSGVWSTTHWPWLSEFGVLTATTCEPGLNTPDTPWFGLRRFLDGENVSQIEFEAELCGFSHLLRGVAGFMENFRSSPSRAEPRTSES